MGDHIAGLPAQQKPKKPPRKDAAEAFLCFLMLAPEWLNLAIDAPVAATRTGRYEPEGAGVGADVLNPADVPVHVGEVPTAVVHVIKTHFGSRVKNAVEPHGGGEHVAADTSVQARAQTRTTALVSKVAGKGHLRRKGDDTLR